MAFSHIQGNGNGASATGVSTISVTLGSPVGSGNLVIGLTSFGSLGVTVLSVTDNAAGSPNTYTLETLIDDTTNNQAEVAFHCANVLNGPTIFTVNYSANTNARSVIVDEFSGNIQQTDGRDGAAHGGQLQASPGTGTDGITSGNFTTVTDGDLIWGGTANNDGTPQPDALGTGFSAGATDSSSGCAFTTAEYRVQTTAGSGTAATFTEATAHRRTTSMIAIKAGAAATPITAGFFVEDTTLHRQPQNQRMLKPDHLFATPAQPLPLYQRAAQPSAAGVARVRMVPN
jgi:hypothetical protein